MSDQLRLAHEYGATPAMERVANVEAEAALISAMLIDNAIIDRVSDFVKEDDFYENLHGRMFRVMSMLAAKAEPVNALILKPYFEHDKAFHEAGGMGYLARLTGSNAGLIGARGFAEQIADLALRRRLIESMQLAMAELQNTGGEISVASILDQLESDTSPAALSQSRATEGPMAMFMEQAIEEWDQPDSRIECGLVPSFDNGIGSLRRGDMVIIAGRPGMGKTAVALSVARGFAENGHGTLILSREMRGADLAERCICDVSHSDGQPIAYAAMTNGRLTNEQKRQACRITERMKEIPLSIIDTPSMKTAELGRRIRRWKRRLEAKGKSADVVIVDYLQLLDPDHKTNGQTEKISEISMALKSMAKEHNVVMIPLSQLSRAVEQRDNKRPQLSDLRDSGQIEQDADAIMFLFRAEYYLRAMEPGKDDPKFPQWESSIEACHNKIEFIWAKVRKGVPSTRHAEFWAGSQAVRG